MKIFELEQEKEIEDFFKESSEFIKNQKEKEKENESKWEKISKWNVL